MLFVEAFRNLNKMPLEHKILGVSVTLCHTLLGLIICPKLYVSSKESCFWLLVNFHYTNSIGVLFSYLESSRVKTFIDYVDKLEFRLYKIP